MGIDYSFSNNIKAGHLSNEGLTESFEGIPVPTHRHDVEMDLKRVSISLLKSINDKWDFGLIIPYYWKSQKASVSFLEPSNSLQKTYAERSAYIHHRTEDYDGIGDIELLAGHKTKDLLKSGSILRLGFGLALPTGKTEDDPWVLGDLGEEHLHIQFGNGTLDPIFNLYYGFPLSEKTALAIYAKTRVPFYHNNQGYRGAVELAVSPMINWSISEKISASTGIVLERYGHSDWKTSGSDPNSGLFYTGASITLTYAASEQLDIGLGITKPFHQRFFGDGESFEIAPSFSFSIRKSF
ncbi:MAG: hypothetical protein MK183_05010 [Verrucomicrobiales bacterium]|nr:hypothetical protein [Verrucomicrobiales bacterium]